MMKRFELLLLMLVLPIAVSAFGDTVILRNGTRYQGATITQSSRSSVAFTDRNGKNRSFAMKNVRSLQFGSSPAATLGKSGTARIISSGTEVAVRSNVAIDSKTAAVGQHFSATIDRDVLDNRGALAIPRGSGAQLFIESPSEGGTSPADMALDVDSITVNGTRYLIATNDVNEKGGRQGLGANKRTAEMVGGGAAIGTLIGALLGHGKGALIGAGVGAAAGAGGQVLTKGKAVQVPAETVLNFKLEQDLVLRPAR